MSPPWESSRSHQNTLQGREVLVSLGGCCWEPKCCPYCLECLCTDPSCKAAGAGVATIALGPMVIFFDLWFTF